MGDFQANFHRPEAGIRTVEGNLAGSRAALLEKKRMQEQEEFEQRKRKIVDDNNRLYNQSIQSKFAGGTITSMNEAIFQEKTIGLVSVDEFKKLQAKANNQLDDDDDENNGKPKLSEAEMIAAEKAAKKAKKKKLKEKRKLMATLSFANNNEFDEINDDEQEVGILGKDNNNNDKIQKQQNQQEQQSTKGVFLLSSKKDPTVDTSFLPDQERDKRIEEERKRLEIEWKEQQVRIKEEKLEIVYSYWDGSGHRRSVTCRKGDTILEFLELVRQDLCNEFKEISKLSADGLLYIKEDLIIPADITFYDLIVTKARGKSGPLFHFDVHDDIRIGAIDSRIEKDESHPGKVVDRRWYERNKHIFPASRWEYYNPVKDYGTYKIGGK